MKWMGCGVLDPALSRAFAGDDGVGLGELLPVIPGREANPESRDSGFDASHHPGMTISTALPGRRSQ
jgi:hypothetical protein